MRKLKKLLLALAASSALVLSGCDLLKPTIYTIQFENQSYSLYLGSEQEILPTVSSNKSTAFSKELVWTVSDPSVASVEDGVVKGLAVGTARVTAALKFNTNFSSFYTVNVIKDNRVTGVSLSKTSVSLDINGIATETITATVTGEIGVSQEVTWSSEDETVATVNNGTITALAVGSTKIKATSVQNPSFSKTCTVSVIDSSSGSLLFTETQVELNINETHTLSFADETSATSVNWSTSDDSIAKVSTRGVVTAKAAGTATITATRKTQTSDVAICKIVVIEPVTVSLDKTSARVKQNDSITLKATLTGDTENKGVTWSSNNSHITVSSTGVTTGTVQVTEEATINETASITAESVADPTKKATCTITVNGESGFELDYTIMLYMCASTLEHDSENRPSKVGLFSCDILEILSVQNIPSTVKIIIETGGTEKWYLPSIAISGASAVSNSALQRWEVTPVTFSYNATDPYLEETIKCWNKLTLVDTLNTNKMSEQSSFQDFLEWGLNDYAAAQMGVIISGHGGGVDGCSYDDNNDLESLNTSEVAAACKNALNGASRDKFTWIGYDCCLMAGIDNASINADYFEYMVASQESENGTGYDHDVYLSEIIKNPSIEPEKLLSCLAKAFVDENHINDCPYSYGGRTYYCFQTTSVINLSKIGTVVSAFNDFSKNVTWSKIKTAFNSTDLNTFGESTYGLVDLNNFLDTYANKNTGISVDAVKNAVSNCIVANYYCSKYSTAPCGLNLFTGISGDSSYDLQVYKANYTGSNQTKLTTWQDLILSNATFYSQSGGWW